MAFVRQVYAAMSFFFSKKHIPELLHRKEELGDTVKAYLYFIIASSISFLDCSMEPKPSNALKSKGSASRHTVKLTEASATRSSRMDSIPNISYKRGFYSEYRMASFSKVQARSNFLCPMNNLASYT